GETVVGCLCKTDNCNSLLYGASKHLVAKLRNIQNGAARIIVRLGKHEHMSPVLSEIYSLYWLLRISYWIVYKPNTSLRSSTDAIRLNLP
ncbi:unnamed protein product, partial [Porites evermanni]